MFAHGQPQTGKSYTLIGQESDPGLLPRTLEALFQQEEVVQGQVAVFSSFYEINKEQVRDILRRDFYTPGGLKVKLCSGRRLNRLSAFLFKALQVRMRPDGKGCEIEGLSKTHLVTMADCEDFLAQVMLLGNQSADVSLHVRSPLTIGNRC